MGKIIKTITILIALKLITQNSWAFTLPSTEIKIGDPVYIEEVDILKHYAVFLPFEEPTNGEVCASMSGEELFENNNLKDFGTCFINDPGIFTIVEIEEPFSSNYTELEENEQIIQKENVTVSLILEGSVSESTDSENTLGGGDEIISDLNSFIQEAQEEIERILGNLLDTKESSESTTSELASGETVLGAKTFNILEILKENYLLAILIILIAVSTLLLIVLVRKTDKDKK